jgi:hypothetical protein
VTDATTNSRTQTSNWRSYLLRAALFVAPGALFVAADLAGLLSIDSLRLVLPMIFIGAFVVLAADAMQRKSRWASTYFVLAMMGGMSILQTETMMGKLQAQWRIARNVACINEAPDARLVCTASYDPCNVAYDVHACWADLYRDAGWSTPDPALIDEGVRQQHASRRERTRETP